MENLFEVIFFDQVVLTLLIQWVVLKRRRITHVRRGFFVLVNNNNKQPNL